ncbi:hypothetical protein BJ980_003055 [Nocardioides daedukensis]|uniref:HNH nuclease domain-containing protein n=1 Tax=Nocardioides daedukensis TaxID=634462 RepID=A0A7Y9URC2_9ACTN|nr:HNH endonuclease signature motif containing protein [Nocardioides daedukensis]NYG60132.1 hypothetical protein [Nocardioides daedukensis]
MNNTAAATTFGVEDLDGAALCSEVSGLSRDALAIAARRYAVAHQWCITHPPLEEGEAATFGDVRLPGLSGCDSRVGGEGTPGVAVFAVEAYAATAGLSTGTAAQILSDALDLQHRLPRTWARVVALELPAWTAAQIARDTTRLSHNCVNWIDHQLDHRGYRPKAVDETTRQAIATFHPELMKKPETGKDDWDVRVNHDAGYAPGTSRLDAIGDSLDLEKFSQLINDEATTLGRLGDPDTHAQRKAKALGVIADRHATCQDTLDLTGSDDLDAPAGRGTRPATPEDCPADYTKNSVLDAMAAARAAAEAGAGTGDTSGPTLADVLADAQATAEAAFDAATAARAASVAAGFGDPIHPTTGAPLPATRSYVTAKLHLHFTLADIIRTLRGDLDPDTKVVDAGRLGAQLLSLVQDWLSRLGSNARITPVIDLTETWAVDQHDPPDRMREQVQLRDQHCVFPYCTITANRTDLDHIDAYDPHGPPGQTNPDNLACLCRSHHRMKTFAGWTYRREPDGSYHWTDPYEQRWRVTPGQGTTPLDPADDDALDQAA